MFSVNSFRSSQPAPWWGGLFLAPPQSFCNISKTTAPIVAKLSVPSCTFILHITFKNCSSAYDRLATDDVRVTSYSAIFDAKKGLAGRALMPTVLKIEKKISKTKKIQNKKGYKAAITIFRFFMFRPQKFKKVLFENIMLNYQYFFL